MTRHYVPPILRSTTPEQDELALHLAQLDAECAKLRNDIVALVRDKLNAQPAVKHLGGVGGAEMAFFRDVIADQLGDLTLDARRWIDSRLEEITR